MNSENFANFNNMSSAEEFGIATKIDFLSETQAATAPPSRPIEGRSS